MNDQDLKKLTRNAQLDQALSGLASIAIASGQFHRDLQAQGFSKAQAFDMTKQLQFILFSSSLVQTQTPEGK